MQAGDTILVHAGLYKYNRSNTPTIAVNRTVPLDGTYYLTADGTAERPIAIKAAGDGEAIFDGAGNFALFDVRAADYTYFEGLTFRNAEIAILAGTQFIAGAKGLTVKRSRFENVGAGVFTNYSGSSNFYIADNSFIGRNDPNHLIGWAGDFWTQFNGVDGQKFPPVMASYVAVKLYGPGHVVAYNYIANFHDGINVETYGNPDGSAAGPESRRPEVSAAGVLGPPAGGDRLLQQLHHQLSRQPDRGRRQHAQHPRHAEHDDQLRVARLLQPADARRAGLLDPQHRLQPAGRIDAADQRRRRASLFYNNTILSETTAAGASNMHWRNNLMLGENSAPAIFSVNTFTNYTSSDYNGFRPNPGATASFQWNSPPRRHVGGLHRARVTAAGRRAAALQRREFATLAEYSKATGQDSHSVARRLRRLRERAAARRAGPQHGAEGLQAGVVRLPPEAWRRAIDRGVALPNVTEGFAGRAPDLGALEVGRTSAALRAKIDNSIGELVSW